MKLSARDKFKLWVLIMEAAVSTGKVNYSKSRNTPGRGTSPLLRRILKLKSGTGRRKLPAAWPNTTDKPIRMQDPHDTQGPAAASYPKHNFTTSPKYLPRPQRRPVSPLCAKAEVAVPDRRMRTQAQTAAWTGAWQCLRLLKLTAPLSALPALQSHARPAASAAFVLPQG